MSLSPIGLSTYIRLDHLKKTITELQKNKLAKESQLFIFSDAAREGDEDKVHSVRQYLRTIKGFKSVNIVNREENNRIKNSQGGINQLLSEYGKVIWIEEDILTAPGFLTFMNSALDFYKDDPDIISIGGYSPPLSSMSVYDKDVFALARYCPWGVGLWREKFTFAELNYTEEDLKYITSESFSSSSIADNGGDLYDMICKDAKGILNAGDLKVMYYQHKTGKLTLYPKLSLVQNNGFDGTGVHCPKTLKFHHHNLWNKEKDFNFISNIKVDEVVRQKNVFFRSLKF